MSRSAADILSITTSRETLFVGPLSAFPVQARRSLLRDRSAVRYALHLFLSRPGAEETIRPYLRRWHIDTTAVRSTHRAGLADMLVLAAAHGTLAIAVAPEVTLAVARLGEDLDARLPTAGARPFAGNALPDDFIDRLFLVAEMIPERMEGAARQEFQALIEGGYEMLVISLVAMLIPGVNVAILGMSLFTLPGQILEALDRLVEVLESIRDAKSKSDLDLAAAAGAVVLVILIREGIMRRFMSAQFVRKGIAALKSKVRKPAPVKTPVRQVVGQPHREDMSLTTQKAPAVGKKTSYSEYDAFSVNEANTFKPKGMSRSAAKRYLDTPEGKYFIAQRTNFYDGNKKKARADVISMLQSCAERPVMQDAPEILVKITPPEFRVGKTSPFFTTIEELQKAKASGKPIHEYFGLPIRSEADTYAVHTITPPRGGKVFVAKVAPTEELGGKVGKEGGALQFLVPDRHRWSEPTRNNDDFGGP